MKELIGKTIRNIYVGQGESILAVQTDQGIVAYDTEGDCCSETWFADIIGVSALIGGVVMEVEEAVPETYKPEEDGRTRQEEDEAYGWKITTDKGYADIIYRNSSNGYYGGWSYLMENPPSAEALNSFTKITDDWHA